MKKVLAILLILILAAAGGLTACSKSKNDSDTVSEKSIKDTIEDTTNGTSDVAADTTSEEAVGETGDSSDDARSDTTQKSSLTEAPVANLQSDFTDSSVKSQPADEAALPEADKFSVTFDTSLGSNVADGSVNSYVIQKDQSTVQYRYGGYYPGIQNTEEFTEITETGFKDTYSNPLSTFSIDVDTASYTNLRKNLNNGIIPEADAVRIEEMINYFDYDYEQPDGNIPFTINSEIGICPWNEENYLLTVGIQGKEVDKKRLPKSNLVFLIDVSGSMDEPDKLPLLKSAFSKLTQELGEDDKVSVVIYAGESGVVLDSVRGNNKEVILDAIENLSAGGSTGGAEGIDLAYRMAEKNFIKEGNNRIILATDGDFNVGPSSVEELEEIIEEKRESGIFLSVMGFGSGNLKDNKLETLADKGNGNYSYIDSVKEAKRVLVNEMAGTILTIAKDVKIQLEFNPYRVAGYRLIGYENRALANEDFKNDTVDAGELGAGHTVTAIYEVIPTGSSSVQEKDLKYQTGGTGLNQKYTNEISEIRLRYKEPDGEKSKEIKQVVSFRNTPVNRKESSPDFCFAAAVAEFGMLLRGSEYQGNSSVDSVLDLAEKGLGEDESGYRLEFMDLVDTYEELLGYSW